VKSLLHKARVLFFFYRTLSVPNAAFSVILLGFLQLYPQFRGGLPELLWFKAGFFALVLLAAHFLAEGRYYFYYNLGCSRRVLFPAAFTLDALLFVLLHRLFEWWQS
jgi:uncharacterized protein YqgC (DUF456 family)